MVGQWEGWSVGWWSVDGSVERGPPFEVGDRRRERRWRRIATREARLHVHVGRRRRRGASSTVVGRRERQVEFEAVTVGVGGSADRSAQGGRPDGSLERGCRRRRRAPRRCPRWRIHLLVEASAVRRGRAARRRSKSASPRATILITSPGDLYNLLHAFPLDSSSRGAGSIPMKFGATVPSDAMENMKSGLERPPTVIGRFRLEVYS